MRTRKQNIKAKAVALPLNQLFQKFSYVFFIVLSLSLIALHRLDPYFISSIRSNVTDIVSPVVGFISAPISSVNNAGRALSEMAELQTENARLRDQVERLILWKQTAIRLEAENLVLRSEVQAVPETTQEFITARVLSDPGAAYIRSLVITAGRKDGVRPGQAVVSGHGLVGRVVEAGNSTSRVLLITDLNTKVPVLLARSREKAMLGGDNSATPELLYLRPGQRPENGELVVTSGMAGLFPASIPVGIVGYDGDGDTFVEPIADLGRLEFVRVIKFGPEKGLAEEALLGEMTSDDALPIK